MDFLCSTYHEAWQQGRLRQQPDAVIGLNAGKDLRLGWLVSLLILPQFYLQIAEMPFSAQIW